MNDVSQESYYRFLKGFSFIVQEEGRVIKAWFSTLSGLEKVFVDGELVSSQRNFSTNTTHTFKIGNDEYSVNLRVISLLKGPKIFTLYKNGEPCKRIKSVYPKKMNSFRDLLFYAGVGLVAGALYNAAEITWNFPKWASLIFLVALFLGIVLYRAYNPRYQPVFEEENIEQLKP